MDRWNPKRRHSPNYYRQVVATILHGLTAGWPLSTIRAALAAEGLKSPTNSEWSEAALAGVLARLRKRTGSFYSTLLELHLEGRATQQQVAKVLRCHV